MDTTQKKAVRRTLLRTTLGYLAVLGLTLMLLHFLPELRLARLERALERGNAELALRLAEKLEDDGQRDHYRARSRYLAAEKAAGSGDLEEAQRLFLSLGAYEDAETREKECRYLLAGRCAAAGEREKARELYHGLMGYQDAEEREKALLYEQAEALLAEDEPVESLQLFCELGQYGDAPDRAAELALRLTGQDDAEKALLLARDMTEEEVARWERMVLRRGELPRDIIDVGFAHTVALRRDGTVLACGSNSDGQCDTGGWTGAVAVAAGAYHTAALLADGTVVTTGRRSEGQCDTAHWQNVTAIAAADYATFGLLSDGTVVACGFNNYEMLSDWREITALSGGSYNVCGLRKNGEAILSHMTGRNEALTGLVDVVCNTAFAAGLRGDGTVVSAQLTPDWQYVTALSAGSTALLGLTDEGQVLSHFFRAGDAVDFSGLTRVVAMAAGGTHFAFVHEDGTVTVLGENSNGQCDTAEWQLFA